MMASAASTPMATPMRRELRMMHILRSLEHEHRVPGSVGRIAPEQPIDRERKHAGDGRGRYRYLSRQPLDVRQKAVLEGCRIDSGNRPDFQAAVVEQFQILLAASRAKDGRVAV